MNIYAKDLLKTLGVFLAIVLFFYFAVHYPFATVVFMAVTGIIAVLGSIFTVFLLIENDKLI